MCSRRLKIPPSPERKIAMKLPESVTQLLEKALSRYLEEDEEVKKDFKKHPQKYLVSLLLVIEERMKEDWISAMLNSTVMYGTCEDYLEEAQKLLEGKERKPQKETTSRK